MLARMNLLPFPEVSAPVGRGVRRAGGAGEGARTVGADLGAPALGARLAGEDAIALGGGGVRRVFTGGRCAP